MPLKKADVLADERALFGDAERLFDVREHHVGGAQAALGEVPGGRGEVDDATVLRGIGPLDERVGHHVLREPGARTGDGGVAVADEDEVGIELDEKLERGFAAVVGVGAVGDVFEAELVADEGALGLEPEHVEVARGDHADDGGSAGGGGADGGGALVEGAARGLGLGGLAEDAAELHELGLRLLEAAELAVGLLIDDGRDAAQFGDLLDEAAAHEDDVGFARHEGLEVDFLGRAGVDDLRVVLVLREPGKGRGLRQGGHAVAEAPGVHGVEDGVVKDGDALRVLRNDDLDGRVLLVEGLHREGFGRLDGDGGQGGGRDEERGERAGEHGLHGFPVRMVTVVERCAWLNEV